MVEYPFGLPLELCEIIFSYLSTKDLLKCCCLINKSWNLFVGQNCMKNILIKFDDKTNLKDIMMSERIYKKAKLMRLSNDKLNHVIKFLSPHVVELELEEIETGENKESHELNNLKELALSCGSMDVFKNFCLKYDKLKILSLYQVYGNSNYLTEFLKINGTIEELNLYINDESCIFYDDALANLNLRLKSTFISYKSNNELQATALANIEKFLIAQGDRLEIISLINSANLLFLLRTWNYMKAVKRLYFFSTDPFFDYSNESILPLEKNFTLEELELHSLAPYPFTLEDIRIFLDSAVNLKYLAVWYLRKDIAVYCEQLKNLKSISYVTCDEDCQSYLKSKNGINAKLRFNQYLV